MNPHSEDVGLTQAPRQSSVGNVVPSSDGCHWRLPDSRKFKFNVDTAWNVDNSSIGGLIRDH